MNELNNQYIDQVYNVLYTEQQQLMSDIKSGCDEAKEKQNIKQFNLLNILMINLLKYKSLKNKITKDF